MKFQCDNFPDYEYKYVVEMRLLATFVMETIAVKPEVDQILQKRGIWKLQSIFNFLI